MSELDGDKERGKEGERESERGPSYRKKITDTDVLTSSTRVNNRIRLNFQVLELSSHPLSRECCTLYQPQPDDKWNTRHGAVLAGLKSRQRHDKISIHF